MGRAVDCGTDFDTATTKDLPHWGPVCRGYQVLAPDGLRGVVDDIRLGDDGVEFNVATGFFVRQHLTIHAAEVEAILPLAHRIVVRRFGAARTANGGNELEAAGGIVRMPVLNSLRPESAPQGPA